MIFDVPGMGTIEGEWASSHATAICWGDTPRAVATSATTASASDPARMLGEWGMNAIPWLVARAQHVFRAAAPDVVGVLHRHDRAQILGDRQVLERHVGDADVADLPFVAQLDECADGLGVGNVGVRDVHLVEIDAVDPQSAQALLALLVDVLGSPQRWERPHARLELPRLEARLRADEQVAGIGVQRLGEDLLTLAVAVDVGDVHEVHAAIDNAAVEPHRLTTIADALRRCARPMRASPRSPGAARCGRRW